MARRQQQRSPLPRDFGLGLVVIGALMCVLGLLLFVVLSMEGAGARSEVTRMPEGAYQETPVSAPATIAAQ